MRRSLFCFFALVLAACGDSSSVLDDGGFDAGPTPVEPLDAGPRNPNIASGFGPFTGAFDVNGAGELFAMQVGDRVALEVNDAQHLYIGSIDGGAFDAGIVYADLASCGQGSLSGSFDGDAGYTAREKFCAGGQPVSADISGERFRAPNVYRQELAWSGVYDATETQGSANGCVDANGSHPLTIGVARELDGGAVTAMLVGDGLLDEVVFGAVDTNSGVLSARAKNSAGIDTSQFTLYFLVDGGVAGTRAFTLGTCEAAVDFTGSKR